MLKILKKIWPVLLAAFIALNFVWSPNSNTDFLRQLRLTLANTQTSSRDFNALEDAFSNSGFPKNSYGFAMTLYHDNLPPARFNAHYPDAGFINIIKTVILAFQHPNLKQYEIKDPEKSRIQIDFITSKPESCNLDEFKIGQNNGMIIKTIGLKKESVILPSDALVYSLSSKAKLISFILNKGKTKSLDKIKLSCFNTESFVSYRNEWIKLNAGIPEQDKLSKERLSNITQLNISHLIYSQSTTGQFLEAYSIENPVNYSPITHATVILAFLDDFQVSQNKRSLEGAAKAVDFLLQLLSTGYHDNGLVLYTLSRYKSLTNSNAYDMTIKKLANIVLNNQPSGQTLLGLTGYYKLSDLSDEEKHVVRQKMLVITPQLMKLINIDPYVPMAISEFWDQPLLKNDHFKNFVYGQARKVIKLKSLHGFINRSVISAYEIAVKENDTKEKEEFFAALKTTTQDMLTLVNTPQASYWAKDKKAILGSVRLNNSSSWTNIKLTAFAASYFLKFLPYL
jgi:hypothetical protein